MRHQVKYIPVLLQFDLARLLGTCKLKTIDKKKFHTITTMERDHSGKPAVKIIEMRCRASLSEYRARVTKYKEDGRLLPIFPLESFYKD